jgi:hypothetical protein
MHGKPPILLSGGIVSPVSAGPDTYLFNRVFREKSNQKSGKHVKYIQDESIQQKKLPLSAENKIMLYILQVHAYHLQHNN